MSFRYFHKATQATIKHPKPPVKATIFFQFSLEEKFQSTLTA